MEIQGYTVFKTIMRVSAIDDDHLLNDPIIIFLKAFPDLGREFLDGKEIYINPTHEHFTFLENVIKDRLNGINYDWKTFYNSEKKEKLKKAGQIIDMNFLGISYEINLFGEKDNRILRGFIELYNWLKECDAGPFGLTIVPDKL